MTYTCTVSRVILAHLKRVALHAYETPQFVTSARVPKLAARMFVLAVAVITVATDAKFICDRAGNDDYVVKATDVCVDLALFNEALGSRLGTGRTGRGGETTRGCYGSVCAECDESPTVLRAVVTNEGVTVLSGAGACGPGATSRYRCACEGEVDILNAAAGTALICQTVGRYDRYAYAIHARDAGDCAKLESLRATLTETVQFQIFYVAALVIVILIELAGLIVAKTTANLGWKEVAIVAIFG